MKEPPLYFILIRDVLKMAESDWYYLPRWVREKYEIGDIIFLSKWISVRTKNKKWIDGGPDEYLVYTESDDFYIEQKIKFVKIK